MDVLPKWRINDPLLSHHVAMNHRQIFLRHCPGFPDFTQFTGSDGVFGDQYNAGGLTIQAIDQMRCPRTAQIQSRPADKTGVLVAFGGVADQIGGLVDDQQIFILVDDIE